MSSNLADLLRTLATRDIEFVVVGGMAGVLQGAPVVTADLDIVHRRTAPNVARLLSVLRDVSAEFRADPRHLQPQEHHLAGPGHVLLQTRLGPLDALGEIQGQGYEALEPFTDRLPIGGGLEVKVLRLDKLIALKAAAGRPKDLAALPTLRATLEEIQRR